MWRRKFQTDDVKTAQFAAFTGYDAERNNVAVNAGHAADHRLTADADKLMNRTVSAQNSAVADTDMSADNRIVGHNHIVADHTVMRNMRVNHKHAVVANRRRKVLFRRSGMHGNVLSDNVALADNQLGLFLKFIAVILRTGSQNGSRKNNRSFADGRVAQNRHMSNQLNVFADFRLAADVAQRADFGAGGNLGTVFNNGGRMNIGHCNKFLI
jgi:hypothetical protein